MLTPTDIIGLLTEYRNGALAVLGTSAGILGKVSSARLNLDLQGVLMPHSVNPVVTSGPAMPPADEPDSKAPTWGNVLGECKKFTHPDKLAAIAAAFQHLQAAMGGEVQYTSSEGEVVTILAGTALSQII